MTERPTIFIGGASSEFRTFRQAVRDVLLAKDIFPIIQDSFPPHYREVRQMLTEHISRSDAVICLVGFAFGEEPRNRPETEPRRSYAQLEYQIARELNKPLYVFLSDETTRPGDQYPAEDPERQDIQQKHLKSITSSDELWHVFKAKDHLLTFVAEIPIIAQAGFRISSGRLSHGAGKLVGREHELENLDKAWDDPQTHIVTIVAWGGVGKTALVVEWMARMARDDWRGADRVFDGSFYSQGTSETSAASADQFVARALEFFGDPDMAQSAASPWDKGERLAQLVAKRKTLLVLDGVEPLQYPPGPVGGKLKDPALEALLKGLAQHNNGLCLVTTREPLTDLDGWIGKTLVYLGELEHRDDKHSRLSRLSVEAGAQLLFDAGVRRAGSGRIEANDQELKDAARDVDGHALTLLLLGRYLAKAHNGDVRKRKHVKFHKADARGQGGHAFRVMAAYEKWLGEAGEEGQRQLAVLHLLGLFDRPANAGCLVALRREPAIEGLTESLIGLDHEDWNYTLSNLREYGFITIHEDELTLDAHPLVREYFGKQLRDTNSDAWREAHRRLYEYLTDSAEYQPDTLAGLQPLYQAIAHGCKAGMYEEAREVIYKERILRGARNPDGFYNTRKLGAYGSDLAAVACFFDRPWTVLSPQLSEDIQAWLLSVAAFDLRALGRLTEALEPMRIGMNMGVRQGDWSNAGIRAGNLSEMELTLGQVEEAVLDAERGVRYADRSNDILQKMKQRAKYADALFTIGRQAKAIELFHEAEAMEPWIKPKYPVLFGWVGFHYCDLLLAPAERIAWQYILQLKTQDSVLKMATDFCKAVEEKATQTLKKSEEYPHTTLLDIALDHLALGRALLYEAILSKSESRNAKSEIEEAVDGLRHATRLDFLPCGLLSRAMLRFVEGDEDGCRADLEEAWQISERGTMRLFMADIGLHRARLFCDKAALPEAERFINECGYHRRDNELADAQEAARNW
ncbi:DUF4062 domain-containing protein [Planctomycetota bacterium]